MAFASLKIEDYAHLEHQRKREVDKQAKKILQLLCSHEFLFVPIVTSDSIPTYWTTCIKKRFQYTSMPRSGSKKGTQWYFATLFKFDFQISCKQAGSAGRMFV